jgi:DNA polymerase-3 subunit epsilon
MDRTGISLQNLNVLILDCQATHSNPAKGTLFEIGWLEKGDPVLQSSTQPIHQPECHLIELPKGKEIPNHIKRITGLKRDDFSTASDETVVWNRLTLRAARIAKTLGMDQCPTVIHYARYEEPFLRTLHERYDHAHPFPFQIICTHTLIQNVLPHLPRKSLRAVAGYFGHTVSENRRSKHHVVATAVIWNEVLEIIEQEYGVRDMEHMMEWLNGLELVKPRAWSSKLYPMDPELRLRLPDKPGVYRMLRSNGDVLYVGKAKSLRRRVNSYFQKGQHHRESMLEMLTQATGLNVTLTDSTLEAALLESDEIKRLAPPYNRALRVKERTPGFYTRDLQNQSETPDNIHRVGPVPKIDSLQPVSLLGQIVREGDGTTLHAEACAHVLGIPKSPVPGAYYIAEGLEMFIQKYESIIRTQHRPWEFRVQRLAKQLYAEREEQAASTAAEEDTDNPRAGEPSEREWTPDKVVATMEAAVIYAAYLIRRGRWLCMLSESAIAWECLNTDRGEYNVLVFEGGNVVDRQIITKRDDIPIPPGFGRSLTERQRCFTIATYDRLRVLMSEVKRLVMEKRSIYLRLNPLIMLNQENLARAFRWL